MLVSVVILNWNGGLEHCKEAIDSAISQDYQNKEIIYVDNGSTDGSFPIIEADYPDITCIALPENIGCPPGRNVGARAAKGELLFFLENDGAWKTNNVISECVDFFETKQDFGAVYTAVEGYETGVLDPALDTGAGHQRPSLTSSFRGGAAVIRADLYHRFNGFPDDFFRQAEERFLSLQIYAAGFKIAYLPHLVMRHKGSDYSDKKKVVGQQALLNTLKTHWRLYPLITALQAMTLTLVASLFSALKSRDFNAFSSAIAVLIKEGIKRDGVERVQSDTLRLVETLRYREINWRYDLDSSLSALIRKGATRPYLAIRVVR